MVQTFEKEMSTLSSPQIDALEVKYIEAAHDLQSKQRDLLNYAPELRAFIEARDALKAHDGFSGYLPETYFSSGDLDPVGAAPKAKPAKMRT